MSEDLSEELEGSSNEPQPTETQDDAAARTDFWSTEGDFIYRHHVEPRGHLHVQEESFPNPWKYIDVTRTSHTSLDVSQDKCINSFWNVSRICGPGCGSQKFKQLPDLIICDLKCGPPCQKQPRRRRNRSSKMPEKSRGH